MPVNLVWMAKKKILITWLLVMVILMQSFKPIFFKVKKDHLKKKSFNKLMHVVTPPLWPSIHTLRPCYKPSIRPCNMISAGHSETLIWVYMSDPHSSSNNDLCAGKKKWILIIASSAFVWKLRGQHIPIKEGEIRGVGFITLPCSHSYTEIDGGCNDFCVKKKKERKGKKSRAIIWT